MAIPNIILWMIILGNQYNSMWRNYLCHGQRNSLKQENYKETGLLVSCGRSFIVLLATNIFFRESYRQKKEKKEEKEKRNGLKNVDNS